MKLEEWLTHTVIISHQLHSNSAVIISGLTSAGAVLYFVVEELGDENQVCEDVEHHCDNLTEEYKEEDFTIRSKCNIMLLTCCSWWEVKHWSNIIEQKEILFP